MDRAALGPPIGPIGFGGRLGPGRWLLTSPPQLGRSAVAHRVALSTALRDGVPTVYLARQQPGTAAARRWLSAISGIPHASLLSGCLSDLDWAVLAWTVRSLANAPLDLIDAEDMAGADLAESLDGASAHRDLGLLVIDEVENLDRDAAALDRAQSRIGRDASMLVVAESTRVPSWLNGWSGRLDLVRIGAQLTLEVSGDYRSPAGTVRSHAVRIDRRCHDLQPRRVDDDNWGVDLPYPRAV